MESLDWKKPKTIPFDKIFIDPNNPRLAAENPPGYDAPSKIFDKAVQDELTDKVKKAYKGGVEDLERSIRTQGWVPLDAIMVWEHPKKPGHYIVVEGNTRTVVLREFRNTLAREEKKLERIEKEASKFAGEDLEQQQKVVEQLRQIVEDTNELNVLPVNAKTAAELMRHLPRLLAVRHITPARQWTPFAENLYILGEYQAIFNREQPGKKLALMTDVIARVADLVSLTHLKTRRAVQQANAFSHFKRNFQDRLPPGETFEDEDQYFFGQILGYPWVAQQFGFGKDDLHLADEMEEVLFKWAFKQPRPNGKENPNVLRKAEDIRLWDRIKKYDDDKLTAFASGLNVSSPDEATSMNEMEAKYLVHKNQISAVDNLRDVIDSFAKLKAESLLTQAAHIRPMLEEVKARAEEYVKMIDAVAAKGAA